MTTTKRYLKQTYSNKNYGEIGKKTGYGNLHVGDIVAYKLLNKVRLNFVAESNGTFFIMGNRNIRLEEMELLTRVIPYNKLDKESCKLFFNNDFYIEEKTVRKLTKSQIEEILGFPIEIENENYDVMSF